MPKPRRVLFAGLFHETHSFVEETTSLTDFSILRGKEMVSNAGNSSPLGGALAAAQKFGWEILPAVDYRAHPSGLVEDEVIETFWREFLDHAQPHLASGVDGLYLVLHGAMVSQSILDVEGEILTRIRQLPGAAKVPIFGVFDLHANFTARMAEHANCLLAYRENPHTDARQAAQEAAAALERTLATGQIPRMFWQHPPVMWSPMGTATASDPMRSLQTRARQIEADSAEAWAVNVLAGFSFADTPETGVSFAIATVGSESAARAQLATLSELAWQKRAEGNNSELPIESVMAQLSPLPPGLTVLVEPSDNIGGGAPGDGTGILRALLKHNISNCAVAINDPESVAKLHSLAAGQSFTLSIGGKGSRLDAGPVYLEVQLVSRSDGKFRLEDRQSHLASMVGDVVDMGPSAVVRHKGITILLTSKKTPPFDLGQWRSQGIEPANLSVIGVKAAVAHRRAYDSIAQRMIWVNTPGPCSSDLRTLPYRHVRRPIYPLDAEV
jgi:microcystin degradation protein MlrC